MTSEIEGDDGRPIKEGSVLVSMRAKYHVMTLLGAGGFGMFFYLTHFSPKKCLQFSDLRAETLRIDSEESEVHVCQNKSTFEI